MVLKKNENLGFEEKMKFQVRKLLKIKSGTLRILGILGAKILKIKSGNFQIFGNLGTRIFFKKNEPEIFGIFGNMSMGILKKMNPEFLKTLILRILKNESGIFWNLQKLGTKLFKNHKYIL